MNKTYFFLTVFTLSVLSVFSQPCPPVARCSGCSGSLACCHGKTSNCSICDKYYAEQNAKKAASSQQDEVKSFGQVQPSNNYSTGTIPVYGNTGVTAPIDFGATGVSQPIYGNTGVTAPIDFSTPEQRAKMQRDAENRQQEAKTRADYKAANDAVLTIGNGLLQGAADKTQQSLDQTQQGIRNAQGQMTNNYQTNDDGGFLNNARQNEVSTDNLTLSDEQSGENSFDKINEHLSGVNGLVQTIMPERNALRGVFGTVTDGTNLVHSVWDTDPVEFHKTTNGNTTVNSFLGFDPPATRHETAAIIGIQQEAANFSEKYGQKAIDPDATLDENAQNSDYHNINIRSAEAYISHIEVIGDAYEGGKWLVNNREKIADIAHVIPATGTVIRNGVRGAAEKVTDLAADHIVEATKFTGAVVLNAPDLVPIAVESFTNSLAGGIAGFYQVGNAVVKRGNDALAKYIFK